MTRRAFTLVEVMVALVVTGLVTSAAWAALQGGIDTHERLVRHGDEVEAAAITTAMVGDALRHALPGVRGGPATFTLTRRAAADSITFLTRGIVEPLGTSGAWRAALWASHDTLHFRATSLESPEHTVATLVPGIRNFRARVLGRGTFAQWMDTWADPGEAPSALQLTWNDRRDQAMVHVQRLGLERLP